MVDYQWIVRVILVGIGATFIMDAWSALLKALGIPTLNYALVGRWLGHIGRGTFMHDNIRQSSAIPYERALGWFIHYFIGVVFAASFVMIEGIRWLYQPTILASIIFGFATVVVPLFVMQPSMGAGIAALKTPTPLKNCLRSMMTHTIFGLGLFVAAVVVNLLL